MKKLESLVVDATRNAVKASLGAVERALEEKPRGDKDNMALIHMFEGLHQTYPIPRHPWASPSLPRRGSDEGSVLSSTYHRRRSKETLPMPIFPHRGGSNLNEPQDSKPRVLLPCEVSCFFEAT